jgi:hypothetical protein
MAEIDLDPNFKYRQANTQNFLQSVQIGANIAERQQMMRMRQQEMEAQAADALIRRNTMELQNQMQRQQMADMLEETEAQKNEWLDYQNTKQSIDAYMQDPKTNPFPIRKMFKSKAYNSELNQTFNQLENISPAYRIQKEADETRKWKMEQAANKLKTARELEASTGRKIVVEDPNAIGGFGINDVEFDAASTMERNRTQSLEVLKSMPMGIRPDALKALEGLGLSSSQIDALSNMAPGMTTAAQRNTAAGVASRVKALEAKGIQADHKAVADLESRLQLSGGRLPQLPAKIADQLNNDFSALEAIDVFNKDIENFEATHGPGSFTAYIGFIPNTYQSLETKVKEASSDKDKEAFAILSEFSGVRNGVLRTRSGQTVTGQEQERINKEIGSEGDKNTLIRVNRFRRNKENDVRGVIERNSDFLLPSYYDDYRLTPRGTSVYNFTAERIQNRSNSNVKRLRFDAQGNEIQ